MGTQNTSIYDMYGKYPYFGPRLGWSVDRPPW